MIRLGAERIFGIGVRGESLEHQAETADDSKPSLAQVMGVLFNVMFLDNLATDVEHLDRLNKLLEDGRIRQADIDGCEKMRPLATFLITPSVDLSELARRHQKDMPYLIQYFVDGLGRDEVACADLMSYLLFTPKYTRELIDIGYKDADRRIDEIEAFLYPSSSEDGRPADVPRLKLAAPLAKRSQRTED